jgi:hypothetical protein
LEAILTHKPISVTTVAVPKKPLKDVMPVRFVEGTLERIDGVAGKFRRAEWIRGVVEEALAKAEKRKPSKGAAEDCE